MLSRVFLPECNRGFRANNRVWTFVPSFSVPKCRSRDVQAEIKKNGSLSDIRLEGYVDSILLVGRL